MKIREEALLYDNGVQVQGAVHEPKDSFSFNSEKKINPRIKRLGKYKL